MSQIETVIFDLAGVPIDATERHYNNLASCNDLQTHHNLKVLSVDKRLARRLHFVRRVGKGMYGLGIPHNLAIFVNECGLALSRCAGVS